jgi:photosystem II stability/assembly factor-like uncharacterized protein
MNESTIRKRLRDALGETAYPPYLQSQIAAGLGRQSAKRQTGPWVLGVVAAVLAIALVVTIVFGTRAFRSRASVPVQPPSVPRSCFGYSQPPGLLESIKMASPTTGWAFGGLHTTDGGAHWKKVLPLAMFAGMPADALQNKLYPAGFFDYYLDGNHYWAVRVDASTSVCLDHATVFSTADGGRTWRQAQVPLGAQPTWGGSVSLQFIDPQHGWLWTDMGPQSGTAASLTRTNLEHDLYATSDGGLTWRAVSRYTPPTSGPTCTSPFGDVRFSTIDTGWMMVTCPQSMNQPQILTTADGGVTWKVRALPTRLGAVCPCQVLQLPTFIDPAHAVLEVAVAFNGAYPQVASVLSTSDGGGTWEALPPGPFTGFTLATDYLDSSHWYVLMAQPGWNKIQPTNDWLYMSADGGHSWTLVQKDLPVGFYPWAFQFFDPDHGFAIQDTNATRGGPFSGVLQVLTTSDGGHTWKVSVPQVTISN